MEQEGKTMKTKIKQLDAINNLLIAVLTLDFVSNDAKADILLTMRINKDIRQQLQEAKNIHESRQKRIDEEYVEYYAELSECIDKFTESISEMQDGLFNSINPLL